MNNITRPAMLMNGAEVNGAASGNGAFSRVNGAERRADGAAAPFAPCPPVLPGYRES